MIDDWKFGIHWENKENPADWITICEERNKQMRGLFQSGLFVYMCVRSEGKEAREFNAAVWKRRTFWSQGHLL
jgi:hypothetical protein